MFAARSIHLDNLIRPALAARRRGSYAIASRMPRAPIREAAGEWMPHHRIARERACTAICGPTARCCSTSAGAARISSACAAAVPCRIASRPSARHSSSASARPTSRLPAVSQAAFDVIDASRYARGRAGTGHRGAEALARASGGVMVAPAWLQAPMASLEKAHAAQRMPHALLIHDAPGAGGAWLASWVAQLLLCTGSPPRPCGICQACMRVQQGRHPDLLSRRARR